MSDTRAIAKTANLMPVVFHLHLKMSSFVPKSMIDINKKELSFVVSNDPMHFERVKLNSNAPI